MQDLFDNSWYSQFLLGVLASLLATGIGTACNWLVAAWRYRRLAGEWEAWWQPVQPGLPTWVGQTMRIRQRFRKLTLKSLPKGRIDHDARHDNLHFDWGAQMQIRGKLYLSGSWYKPGGPGSGAFLLRRSNDDQYLCGYIIGDNRDGDVKMGPFVLGKNRAHVLAGMRWLRDNWREFEPPTEMKGKL
ncbi:MAG TPA: hypothetical protein VHC22_23775 [Pirellulales bacterium]|nr:hypothetical protein [Pirellulales bacterium]